MASALPLRPYQRADLDAVYAAWRGDARPTGDGVVNRAAVVAATGLGKTVEFATLVSEWIAGQVPGVPHRPGSKVLVMVHRDELARQARAKIHGVAPHLRVGIVKGTQNEVDAQVIVASVQTVGLSLVKQQNGTPAGRKGYRHDSIRGVGLIVADECHHAVANTWLAMLRHFGAFDGIPTAGFTATMSREDGKGLGEVWSEIVAQHSLEWGIRNDFLVPLHGKRIQVPSLDLRGVRVDGGAGAQDQVGELMIDANTGGAIAKAIGEHAPARRGPVFAPNVASAVSFAESINQAGYRAEIITGETPPDERQSIFSRLEHGTTRWVCSMGVLTEGWDAPWADCGIIARPTKSAGLYQQMIGRMTRKWQNKADSLILDMVGATTVHGLASLLDLSLDGPDKLKRSLSEIEPDDEWPDEDSDWTPEQQPELPVARIIAQDVDLFANSDSIWLTTHGGIRFVPAGEYLFFLWPEIEPEGFTGLWTVGATPTATAAISTPLIGNIPLDMAMLWAEKYATEQDPSLSSSKAPWRRKPPSVGLRNRAARLKIKLRDENQGQVHDLIQIDIGSRRLDVQR